MKKTLIVLISVFTFFCQIPIYANDNVDSSTEPTIVEEDQKDKVDEEDKETEKDTDKAESEKKVITGEDIEEESLLDSESTEASSSVNKTLVDSENEAIENTESQIEKEKSYKELVVYPNNGIDAPVTITPKEVDDGYVKVLTYDISPIYQRITNPKPYTSELRLKDWIYPYISAYGLYPYSHLNTKPDASGEWWPSSFEATENQPAELYVIWMDLETLKPYPKRMDKNTYKDLTFYANDGTGKQVKVSSDRVYSSDGNFSLIEPSFQPPFQRYKFMGWNTKPDGSGAWHRDIYVYGENYNQVSEYYAIWQKPKQKVITTYEIVKTPRLVVKKGRNSVPTDVFTNINIYFVAIVGSILGVIRYIKKIGINCIIKKVN